MLCVHYDGWSSHIHTKCEKQDEFRSFRTPLHHTHTYANKCAHTYTLLREEEIYLCILACVIWQGIGKVGSELSVYIYRQYDNFLLGLAFAHIDIRVKILTTNTARPHNGHTQDRDCTISNHYDRLFKRHHLQMYRIIKYTVAIYELSLIFSALYIKQATLLNSCWEVFDNNTGRLN